MPNVPSTRWSVFDVLSSARELAKTTDQERIVAEQGKYFYKLALSEIAGLLNKSSDPAYFTSTPLTLGTDIEFLTNTITVVNDTTKVISRNSGTFVTGSLVHLTYITASTGAIPYQFTIRIVTGGANAIYVVVVGTSATFNSSTQYCSAIVEKSNTSITSVDISAIDFDQIVSIEDSTYGQCLYVSPKQFASAGATGLPHSSYEESIIWTLSGNYIRFKTGSRITSAGTKTMYYQRQPSYPTDAGYTNDTTMVDLADKWIPLLIKRIYTYMLLQTEPDIPKNLAQEMSLDYQLISAFGGSEVANKDKDKSNITNKT